MDFIYSLTFKHPFSEEQLFYSSIAVYLFRFSVHSTKLVDLICDITQGKPVLFSFLNLYGLRNKGHEN